MGPSCSPDAVSDKPFSRWAWILGLRVPQRLRSDGRAICRTIATKIGFDSRHQPDFGRPYLPTVWRTHHEGVRKARMRSVVHSGFPLRQYMVGEKCASGDPLNVRMIPPSNRFEPGTTPPNVKSALLDAHTLCDTPSFEPSLMFEELQHTFGVTFGPFFSTFIPRNWTASHTIPWVHGV